MTWRFGGVAMVLVSALTAGCGLLLLGGVGPSARGARLPGEPVPAVVPATEPSTTTTTMAPSVTTTTTSESTTTTTSTTLSTTSTITITSGMPSPIPLAVSASQQAVGAGGVVTFSGECPVFEGTPLGPIVVWITGQRSEAVTTGLTAEAWTYAWTAPVDEAEFSSFTFRFWCGDPAGYEGEYPADLERTVDMVAAAPPVGTTPPAAIIPATG